MANDIENRIEQYVDILVAESDADRDEIQDKMYRFVHKYHLPVNKAASKICPEQDIEIPESFEEADNKARKQDELEHHIDTLVAKSDADRDKIQDMIQEFVNDYKVPLDDAVLATCENFNIEPPESVRENNSNPQNPHEETNSDQPFNLDIIKRQVINKDNNECQNCGFDENLTVDHIVPRDCGGNFTTTNTVTLCEACYNSKNAEKTHKKPDYPKNWDKVRKKVYQRDDYRCQNCGLAGSYHQEGHTELHAHHIVPRAKRGNDVMSNYTTLCKYCHENLHDHL